MRSRRRCLEKHTLRRDRRRARLQSLLYEPPRTELTPRSSAPSLRGAVAAVTRLASLPKRFFGSLIDAIVNVAVGRCSPVRTRVSRDSSGARTAVWRMSVAKRPRRGHRLERRVEVAACTSQHASHSRSGSLATARPRRRALRSSSPASAVHAFLAATPVLGARDDRGKRALEPCVGGLADRDLLHAACHRSGLGVRTNRRQVPDMVGELSSEPWRSDGDAAHESAEPAFPERALSVAPLALSYGVMSNRKDGAQFHRPTIAAHRLPRSSRDRRWPRTFASPPRCPPANATGCRATMRTRGARGCAPRFRRPGGACGRPRSHHRDSWRPRGTPPRSGCMPRTPTPPFPSACVVSRNVCRSSSIRRAPPSVAIARSSPLRASS